MKCWPTSKAATRTVDEHGVKTQSVTPSLITRAHHTAHGLLKGVWGGVCGGATSHTPHSPKRAAARVYTCVIGGSSKGAEAR